MPDEEYLIVVPACEVNERGTRDKNDGNEVVDFCDLPLDLDLTERVEVDDETLPYAKEDWDCPEQTEVDKGVQPDFPFTMETASLAADFKKEYRNIEFLWKQRPGVGGMIALPPVASQIIQCLDTSVSW